MIQEYLNCGHLLGLQGIERLVEDVVIPLVGNQLVVMVDDWESIDQGGAQEGVHILWHVLSLTRSVLRPVGEVTHHLGGRSCVEVKELVKKMYWFQYLYISENINQMMLVDQKVLQLTQLAYHQT